MKVSDLDQSTMSKLLYDTNFRKRLRNHDLEAFRRVGVDTETIALNTLKVVTCPADTLYIPVLHMTTAINETELQQLQAAGTMATASTASTAGSYASICGTVSTIGSAGSVGTAGSANV